MYTYRIRITSRTTTLYLLKSTASHCLSAAKQKTVFSPFPRILKRDLTYFLPSLPVCVSFSPSLPRFLPYFPPSPPSLVPPKHTQTHTQAHTFNSFAHSLCPKREEQRRKNSPIQPSFSFSTQKRCCLRPPLPRLRPRLVPELEGRYLAFPKSLLN